MDWLGSLLRLRETRMPIGQMLAFAGLRGEGNATVPARRQMLQTHLAGVLASITAMRTAAKALQAKIAHYEAIEHSLPPLAEMERKPHDDAAKPQARPRTQRRTANATDEASPGCARSTVKRARTSWPAWPTSRRTSPAT